MNRKRIALTTLVVLALSGILLGLLLAGPVLYLLYPAGILLGALCGGLWILCFLRWRWPAVTILLAAAVLGYHAFYREHLGLLLLSAIENLELRLPADATARAVIGFSFGFIVGVSVTLLVNLLVSGRGDGKPDAR
jgi:hypothetical protein